MDKKQKNQTIIIIALLAVLVFVWYSVIFGLPFGSDEPEPVSEAPDEVAEEPENDLPDLPEDDVIREYLEKASKAVQPPEIEPILARITDRDIFEPPETLTAVAERDSEEFNLTSIVWTQERPMAIINNRIVSEGDEIADDAQIERINVDSVIIERQHNETTSTIELSLEPE